MRAPQFSVVIPVHNREALVRRALGSVLDQTFSDFEVIVVDDGSTDGSSEAASSVDDPRIAVMVQPHGGAAAARNLGARRATARFLTFLDSDDVVEKTWLAEFHQLLDAPGVEVASCAVRYEHLDGALDRVDVPGPLEGIAGSPPVMFRHGGSYALALATFRSVGGFDEQLPASQHTELAYRVLSALGPRSPVACVATEQPLLRYRIGSPDGIRKDDRAVMAAAARIVHVHRDLLKPATRARYHAVAANRAARLGQRRRALTYSRATLKDEPTLRNLAKAVATVVLPATFWKHRALRGGSRAAGLGEMRAAHVSFLSLQSQYHNFGDVVLLQVLVRQLAARGRVVVRTKDVPETVVAAVLADASVDVEQVDGSLLRRAIMAAFRARLAPRRKPHAALWMKPGHMTLGGSLRGSLTMGSLLRLIRALGGDTVRVGVSVQMDDQGARWGARYFVRSFSVLGTREEGSRRTLEDLGAEHILSGPDLALAGLAPPAPRSNSRDHALPCQIIFSLRDPSQIRGADPRRAERVQTVLKELPHWFIEQGDGAYSVHAQVAGDLSFTTEVLRSGWDGSFGAREFVPGTDTFEELLENLCGSDFVVTNRLHVIVFALAAGTLPVAILDPSAQMKVSGYLEERGLGQLVVDATQPDWVIREQLDQILEGRGELLTECRHAVIRTVDDIDALLEQFGRPG